MDSKKIFMYRKRTELNNVLQSLLSYKYMLSDINKKFIFNISSIGKILCHLNDTMNHINSNIRVHWNNHNDSKITASKLYKK